MCDDDGDGASTVDAREYRRARKEHRCWACGERIRRGDRYHHTVSLWEGSWATNRHCLRCYAICEALWAAGAGAIDLALDCGETWEEAERGPLPESVARLAFLTADEAQAALGARP